LIALRALSKADRASALRLALSTFGCRLVGFRADNARQRNQPTTDNAPPQTAHLKRF
jgi:hypothetical protein